MPDKKRGAAETRTLRHLLHLQDLTPSQAVGAVPGLVALGLAALYGIGALLWTAELRGADIHAPGVLGFVPLEQILARGIGTAVIVGVLSPVVAAAYYAMVRTDRRGVGAIAKIDELGEQLDTLHADTRAALERGDRAEAQRLLTESDGLFRRLDDQKPSTALFVGAVGMSMLLLAYVVLISPPVRAAGVSVGTLVAVALLARHRHPPPPAVFLGAVGAFALSLSVLQAFAAPHRLPTATVMTSTGYVKGRLLSADGNTLNVIVGKDTVTNIPARRVNRSRIVFDGSPRKTMAEIIFGRRFAPE